MRTTPTCVCGREIDLDQIEDAMLCHEAYAPVVCACGRVIYGASREDLEALQDARLARAAAWVARSTELMQPVLEARCLGG